MTQKEHKEIVEELEKQIKELKSKLNLEQNKTFNYERVLEDYHIVNEELRNEKEYNRLNCNTINELKEVIARYEKILDKFTINYQ